jgi:hypothetical protein
VKWLESLFAAIDVAAPIDDRDFPRDQSIPRIQRIRWYHTQALAQLLYPIPTARPFQTQASSSLGSGELSSIAAALVRRSSSPDLRSGTGRETRGILRGDEVDLAEGDDDEDEDEVINSTDGEDSDGEERNATGGTVRRDPISRLSTTSYPNDAIDPGTGKWAPIHAWSNAHDMLYAKLCYSVLLFKSPRKSNYIISKGKQWYVDWASGRMVRVLPPAYGEIEYFGPWQIVHTENMRI